MPRKRSLMPWMERRGNHYYVFWYDSKVQEVRRRSLRTCDADLAKYRMDAFAEGRDPNVEVVKHPWAAWARRMCKRARENAKQKNRPYSLDPKEILEVMERQDMCCAVTGIPFSNEKRHRNPFAPSLDQIKAGAGYTSDNVRVVLTIVNTAMNMWGAQPLFRMISETRFPSSWPETR